MVSILIMAANLRPTITGVGPLIAEISRGTGLSPGLAGMVTTLPLIAFGLISPIAPRAARRLGLERTLYIGLIILLAGTLCRSLGTAAALLAGMFLVGAGVAIGNVLLPSLVKRDFPQRIGLMTGVYTTVMNIFAGLGSGISVPLAHGLGLGWRGALLTWAILTVVALLLWLPHLRQRHLPDATQMGGMWRSPVAWQITFFMGLQSLLFYVNVAWLPTLLHDRGLSLSLSGWLVSLMQIVSLPGTFLVPIMAGRQRRQQNLVAAISALFFVGYLGLLITQGIVLSIIWVIFIGFGAGASISLALAFFSLRTHTHHQAGQISGMAQSIGYLLAAAGPFTVGLLHSASGAWTMPLMLLLVVVLLMAGFGLGAGRDVYINPIPPAAERP
ncbi:CynX/NimT family MFS transporter [Sulfobacillus harzensis]|uniref:MFS transporter n=1 Tax=Sulfobacillus harzensis TaxID=2729629 RepID=A0A7Y0L842_9FIRM|nr:MFS transporter [Sulfobacillus harzensis]NMP24521.1 MFS transporter [Sulfobacillus harzensis]